MDSLDSSFCSPLKKKPRRDESDDSFMNCSANVSMTSGEEGGSLPKEKPDGIIRLNIRNLTSLTRQYSQFVQICGIPWELKASAVPSDSDPSKKKLLITVGSNMGSDSSLWKCTFTSIILIKNRNHANIFSQKNPEITATCDHKRVVFRVRYPWGSLLDSRMGFLDNNTMNVEVWIYVKSLSGIVCKPRFDFSVAGDTRSNIVLMVEGKPVHVNKQFLGIFSPIFHTFFFKVDAEEAHDESELMKDVAYEEFIELLQVIYPSAKTITDDSAEYLLKLGDRFQITCVVERAEECLITSDKIYIPQKLRIADQYKLARLQDHCLSALRTVHDFDAVKESFIYFDLSDASKAALFKRMVKMIHF